MRNMKVMTADEAAMFVEDGMTIASSGFVGSAIPESLTKSIGKEIFWRQDRRKNLTYFLCRRPGKTGTEEAPIIFAHKGMTKKSHRRTL